MTSTQIKDVLMNFVALTVISSFDNAFYCALGDDPMKKINTDHNFNYLYKIKTTTSSYAALKHEAHKLDDPICVDKKGKQIKGGQIYVDFKKRSWCNAILRCIYLIYRTFYVSVYFYFLPFILLLGSYYVPSYIQLAVKNGDYENIKAYFDSYFIWDDWERWMSAKDKLFTQGFTKIALVQMLLDTWEALDRIIPSIRTKKYSFFKHFL